MTPRLVLSLAFVIATAACGSGSSGPDAIGGDDDDAAVPIDAPSTVCIGVTCSGHGTCVDVAGAATCQCDGGYVRTDATTCVAAVGPTLAGCPVLPVDNVFNTAIDTLPVHPQSAAFIATIGGTRRLHLDLGTTTDPTSSEFYGIPFNIVHGAGFAWPTVAYLSTDPDLDWDTRGEGDCATGAGHTLARPCSTASAPSPLLPIPNNVVVEGGTNTAANQLPYGDHHILLLDADSCWLWETYHSYSPSAGTWNIFGSAQWDLRSNALRPAGWTSSDAAGFPILPLLLRADEASTGTIRHALRFTIGSSKIRNTYVWPARHQAGTSASTSLPPMGQLFRLKASFVIPASDTPQAKAILQAMKTYGMYIADGGSDMYVTGDPSAAWQSGTFSQVQSVAASNFEAVDLAPIMARPGWSVSSGRAP
jgi:hypothetical protein